MTRAAFIYDDMMSRHELRGDHPMRPVRLRYTYELLRGYDAFEHGKRCPGKPAVRSRG